MYKSEHVIPAQAGIHSRQGMSTCDPRLRGDDSGFLHLFSLPVFCVPCAFAVIWIFLDTHDG
jgi:hypothetical protein